MAPSKHAFLLKKSSGITFFAVAVILIAISFSSCAPVDGKITPPETKIEHSADKYGKNGIILKVSGKDEKTVPEKLFFSYKLFSADNVNFPVLEATTTSTEIKIDNKKIEKEGLYRIKVAAVNEYGLIDESPAEASFVMDYTAPLAPSGDVKIEAGELVVSLGFPEKQKDLAGFRLCLIYPDGRKQYFESILNEFTYPVRKGDKMDFEAIAIDDVNNESKPSLFKVDASKNLPPSIAKNFKFPEYIGLKTDSIDIDYFDDWDDSKDITVEATLCGNRIVFKNKKASINPLTLVEGEGVLELNLTDKNKSNRLYSIILNIDLTPPISPSKPELKNTEGFWLISWPEVEEVSRYEIFASNDGEQWEKIGDSERGSFSFNERFLQYAVGSVDFAGNKSRLSFPVRSYDEKYKAYREKELDSVDENLILTRIYSPYHIGADVYVPEGRILAVENGVELLFLDEGRITVEGQFIVMPSMDKTEKTKILCVEYEGKEPLFAVNGGTVWMEDASVFIDENCSRTFLEAGENSVINIRRVDSNMEGAFLNLESAECVSVSYSEINAKTAVAGSGINKLKIDTTVISCDDGMNITQGREITISDMNMTCENNAIIIGELTNLQVINSTIRCANGLQAYKFSTAEIYDSTVFSSDTAIKAKEASTVNIRKTDIESKFNGISAHKNSYVSFVEGSVSGCAKAISLDQSEIFLSNVKITDNEIGLSIGRNSNVEKEEVIFEGNGEDITETL